MDRYDVFIAGAGPTGMWLARQGVKVAIVDKAAQPGTASRAMAVQARTLELYRQLGLADEVVAASKRNVAINMPTTSATAPTAAFATEHQPFMLNA